MATDTATPDERDNHPLRLVRSVLGEGGKPLSQVELGLRCGIADREKARLLIVDIERGKNKATSSDVREALAKGLKLTSKQVADLLAGKLTPEKAAEISRAAGRPSLAQVVAAHPGRWTPEDVAGVEYAAASEGAFAQGWEGLLDDLKAVREAAAKKAKPAKKAAAKRR